MRPDPIFGILELTLSMSSKHINEIAHDGLLWVNVTRQNEKELEILKKRFGLNNSDVEESYPPFQRPKLVKRPGYYFGILHFPIFDRETRRLGFTEVDIFLSPTWLITVHNGQLHGLENFFNDCRKTVSSRAEFFSGTMAHALFELWRGLLEGIFPILLHVNDDINAVDRKLFNRGHGRQMVEEILRLKTNIVSFRRAMQGHRTVIDRLVYVGGRELDLPSYQNYIAAVRDSSVEIWHMLESQKESINALHETNQSMVSLRLGEVMKTLTIISVITFPLTLVATLFAIRAGNTPFVENPYGFWIILAIIIAGAGVMLAFFKKRRWM